MRKIWPCTNSKQTTNAMKPKYLLIFYEMVGNIERKGENAVMFLKAIFQFGTVLNFAVQ